MSTFVSESHADLNNAEGTSLVINKPANVQVGDFLLAFIFGSNVTVAPAGWVRPAIGFNGTYYLSNVYCKYVAVGEAASYTWTVGDTNGVVGNIVAYRDVNQIVPTMFLARNHLSSTANLASLAVNNPESNVKIIYIYGSRNNTGNVVSITPDASTTKRSECYNTGGAAYYYGSMIAEESIVLPGVLAVRTAVSNPSSYRAAVYSLALLSTPVQGKNFISPLVDTDDGYISSASLYTASTTTGWGPGTSYMRAFCRFPNIQIQKGASILSAYLHLVPQAAAGADVNTVIDAFDEDNAASPVSRADYVGRAVTTNVVNWNPTPAFVIDVAQQSPSLVNVISEVISRSGWMPNNALVLDLNGAALAANKLIWSFYNFQYSIVLMIQTSSVSGRRPMLGVGI